MNAGLIRKNQGSGHSYELDGRWIPGVTTVIGAVLDKPALVSWAARETAAYADEHWARLSGMRSADRIVELERARYATNKKATQKGHRIHALAERIQAGETVDVPTEILADVEHTVAALRGSWQGEGSDAQAQAQKQWDDGAEQMQQALSALQKVADAAHKNYTDAVTKNGQMWQT